MTPSVELRNLLSTLSEQQIQALLKEAAKVIRVVSYRAEETTTRKELRIQQLAKYIMLAEMERIGVSDVDLHGVVAGSFRQAEHFDRVCAKRMTNIREGKSP